MVPLLALDYAFMKKDKNAESDDKTPEVKILVGKDSKSKYLFAVPVPQKGIDGDEWAVRKVIQMVEFLGYERIIIKCDQESALKAVVDKVRSYQGAKIEVEGSDGKSEAVILEGQQMMTESSPVSDSQSNGLVERAVRSEDGQMRTMLDALQTRLGITLSADDCVISWLVMHSAEMLNHFNVGHDGETPYQRLRGVR